MEILSQETGFLFFVDLRNDWIRVGVISGSYVVDKNNNSPFIHDGRK